MKAIVGPPWCGQRWSGLRDVVAAGTVDRLYVHSPDRLARKYAYQVLLVDEFQRAGVEVVFLNRALGRSPEDDLLLQVQGMMAEYERAKIIERHRRGKLHAARMGVGECAQRGALWLPLCRQASRVVARRAMRSSRTKPGSSAKSLTGSGATA